MRNQHRPIIAVYLSALVLLMQTWPAFSDSMWVPRFGYPTFMPKRIYLNVVTPDIREEDEKAKKKEAKEAKKQEKENQKALKKQQQESALEGESLQSAESQEETGEQSKLSKTESRKQAERERLARQKERVAQRLEKQQKAPVDGNFFLYNLKQERILFQESSELQPAESMSAFYVEFKEDLMEGLYDLAVRGSGHRSKQPIRVSDAVYWEALEPVLQDIGKSHCPKENGRYRIIQQCFNIRAEQDNHFSSVTGDSRRLVKGGWYTEDEAKLAQGVVKDTAEIANITTLLLQVYQINPQSYKYLLFSGDSYAQSRYPDLLDEVNWGLQYLLTVQNLDGSFPNGILKSNTQYQIADETPEATAMAIMALSEGARAFRAEELSLAVKFVRAAEKGWRYLVSKQDQVDPEQLLLAAYALSKISDNPEYTAMVEQTRARLKTISVETAILLDAPLNTEFAVRETKAFDPHSKAIATALPLLLQLQQQQTAATPILTDWITNLFGYEEIQLVRDENLQLVSAWVDPLQWFATKTGEVATRLGNRLEDEGIVGSDLSSSSERLKALESKEEEARSRIQRGYEGLSLTTLEKTQLAYLLALLNQNSIPIVNEKKRKAQPEFKPADPPPGASPKGFYPKMI